MGVKCAYGGEYGPRCVICGRLTVLRCRRCGKLLCEHHIIGHLCDECAVAEYARWLKERKRR